MSPHFKWFFIYVAFSAMAGAIAALCRLGRAKYPFEFVRSSSDDVLFLVGRIVLLGWIAWIVFVKGGAS